MVALTKQKQVIGSWGLLNTVTGIDLTSSGTTTLYTVPSNVYAIVKVVLEITDASGFVSAATAGVGIAAGESDIHGAVILTALNGSGEVWQFDNIGLARTCPSSSVIKLGVDVGAIATTLDAKALVFGALIPN